MNRRHGFRTITVSGRLKTYPEMSGGMGHEHLLHRSPLESAPTRAHGRARSPRPYSSQPVAEPPPAPPWEALLGVVGLVVLNKIK